MLLLHSVSRYDEQRTADVAVGKFNIGTLVSRRPPIPWIMKNWRQRWAWWGARAVVSRIHTKVWLRLLLGQWMKLVLNLMQWRVLIALNMHVLHVECWVLWFCYLPVIVLPSARFPSQLESCRTQLPYRFSINENAINNSGIVTLSALEHVENTCGWKLGKPGARVEKSPRTKMTRRTRYTTLRTATKLLHLHPNKTTVVHKLRNRSRSKSEFYQLVTSCNEWRRNKPHTPVA